MNHIILLTHGEFSKGIAQSLTFILGDVADVTPLSITLNETVDETVDMIEKVYCPDKKTILITDIPGGSTTQSSIRMLEMHPEIYLVSGLNLGLLLSLAMLELTDDREENLANIRQVIAEAKDTLTLVNDITVAASVEDEEGEL